MVTGSLLTQKACQLKGNTSVNSCAIFIYQKLRAHWTSFLKTLFGVPVHLNIACVKLQRVSGNNRQTENCIIQMAGVTYDF